MRRPSLLLPRDVTRTALTLLALLFVSSPARAADTAPAWLQEAARMPSSALADGQDAIVLQDDIGVTVAPDGRVTTRRRYAVRVLTRGGAAAASAREVYLTSGGVRSLRAWTIDDGRATQLGKDETADLAMVDNDVYNEVRVRVISAARRMSPGMVFGAETETSERSVFTQLEWLLQEEYPVLRLRRSLDVPAGWDVRWVTLNGAAIEPVREGNAMVWSASGLRAPVLEASGPPPIGLVPRIAVSYFDATGRLPSFQDWPAVSRWLADLQAPHGALTPAVRAKALELTATSTTVAERIAAIAAHMRRVQYISIQTGLGRGGGYIPHAAGEVLQKNYGDCKDKANLMRALLASVDIKSTLVTVYAGDATYVREEWASPQQFNHVIIAIEVPADYRGSAVGEVEGLGRVLFFDPTDEQTPVGNLSLALQDSFGLPVVAERGRLVRLPSTPPESHSRARTIESILAADGTLTATFREVLSGDPATAERYWVGALPAGEYRKRLEAVVGRYFRSPMVLSGELGQDPQSHHVQVTSSVRAYNGQVLTPQTMLVAPPQGLGATLPSLPPIERTTPLLLDMRHEQERFELALPASTVIDEMPSSLAIETPFGGFAVRWTMEHGKAVRVLQLRLARARVSAADYGAVAALLAAFREAESQSIVLRTVRPAP